MPVRLTDTAIARAMRTAAETTTRRDLADAGCPGLRLRLTAAGRASWALACRDKAGRMRRYSLGAYPTMGISEARTAARALHHKVRQEGADPVADRRRDRSKAAAARQGIGTLAAVIAVYEAQRGGKLRSWPEYKRSISRVFGSLMSRPVGDVSLGDLQLAADGYGAQQQAALAVRCLRPVLKWGSAPGRAYLSVDLARITTPAAPRRRDRVLSRDELASLLPALRASARSYANALRFMLLTLARREEVAGTRWRDVDMKAETWTIAAERVKNRQQHVVPLSRQALALLRSQVPVDEDGNAVLPDPDALVFSTSTGGALGNWDRETKRLIVASGLGIENEKTGAVTMKDGSAMWTRHDLRRSGATMLGEMGELPDIIEAALNHVAIHSPLAATYNRSRYRPQVAAALQRLADALDGIEAGAGAVVPLRRVGD